MTQGKTHIKLYIKNKNKNKKKKKVTKNIH